jgi:hypothetical protein
MFDLTAIFWLIVLGLVALYWRQALIAKEQAYVAALRHCKQMQVQLLDQNVHLRRLWFKRDERGQLCLWRAFYFEFSALGDERYQGRVIMLGSRVTSVELEPHRIS